MNFWFLIHLSVCLSEISVELRSYRWLQTMIFAVREINNDPAMLPNLTLGYLAADTCLAEASTLSAALAMVTGQDETVSGGQCTEAPRVPVMIGDARSSASMMVADTLGIFDIPMVGGTCQPIINLFLYHIYNKYNNSIN